MDATVKKHIPLELLRLVDKFNEDYEKASNRVARILYTSVRRSVRQRAYKTGFLYNSIEVRDKAFQSFTSIEVYTNCFYAGFVERGTVYIYPRRMFQLGLEEALLRIENEVVDDFKDIVK